MNLAKNEKKSEKSKVIAWMKVCSQRQWRKFFYKNIVTPLPIGDLISL